EVTLRGIVMSSLVNQDGFYLCDGTGMIAVKVSNVNDLEGIKPGNEIVVKGTKTHITKDKPISGQCVIDGAEIVANYYGQHEYDTSYFITDKTITDLSGFVDTDDYTTNVYVLQAKIIVETGAYSSTIKLQDPNGSATLMLYSSGSKQYSWLLPYEGQTVTMELAMCNWNAKGYKACVISITVDGQKVVNTLNFAQ
ncbi:MAG: hypothetical protein IJB95_06825, partial [Clostridia bacterium]|nr:hypothetical protein [Clostridia bacterium]